MKTEHRTLKYIIVILLATSTYSCTLFREIGIFQPAPHKKRRYTDLSTDKKNPVKNKNIPESTPADSQSETCIAEKAKVKENIQQSDIKHKKVKVNKNSASSKDISEIASKKPAVPKLKKSTNKAPVSSKKKYARIHIKKLIVFNSKTGDKTVTQNDNTNPFFSKYSKKLGISLDGTENTQLIMAVDEWLGTPFQWGGCSKYGIDCSCLVQSIYKNVYGIELNRTTIGMFTTNLVPVEKDDLQEGDLIFFKIKDNRISHVGIYLKDNKFIHSTLTKGVMINDLDQNYYRKRFLSGRRVTDALQHVTKLSPTEKKQNPSVVSFNQISRVKSEAAIQDTKSNSMEWLKHSITHHKNFGGLRYASPTLYSRIN